MKDIASETIRGITLFKEEQSSRKILHIPHSSVSIPNGYNHFFSNEKLKTQEINKLTDFYVDELFHSEIISSVIFPWSRIFCDVERFIGKKEPMEKSGMGVIYKTTDNGKAFKNIEPFEEKYIIENYYQTHHNRLIKQIKNKLNLYKSVLIIDCHSFSDKPFKRDLDQTKPRPDFCIGTDTFHTPSYLTTCVKDNLEKKGFSVKINSPYSGTIIPLPFLNKNKNVQSIMIEVNRKLYMNERTRKKSKDFDGIKNILLEIISNL